MIRERGWPIPGIAMEMRKAVNTYSLLHSARTRDFPGAFRQAWQSLSIEVDDEAQAGFISRAWDRFYQLMIELRRKQDYRG